MRSLHVALAVCLTLAACAPSSVAPTPIPSPAAETPRPPSTLPARPPTATPQPTTDPAAQSTGRAVTQAALAARTTERAAGTATADAGRFETQQAVWATEIAAQKPLEMTDALTSPDQAYRVELLRSQCAGVSQPGGSPGEPPLARVDTLVLVNSASGDRSEIESQVSFCAGLGAAGLAPVRWSADSRFLYFTTAAEGAPDGAPCYWSRPLVRLDIRSGERTLTAEGAAAPDGLVNASPVRNRIVIWAWDQAATVEIDLGQDVLETTRLAWSQDGAQLAVLSFGSNGCWGARAPWLTVIDRARGAIVTQWDLDAVDWAGSPLSRAPWGTVSLAWAGSDALRLSPIQGPDDTPYALVARLSSGEVEISRGP